MAIYRNAPRSAWEIIRQDFHRVYQEINTEPESGHLDQHLQYTRYNGRYIYFRFFDHRGIPATSRKNAIDGLHAVEKIFFTLRDNSLDPRELQVLITAQTTHPSTISHVNLLMEWFDPEFPRHWPEPLPSLHLFPDPVGPERFPVLVEY